MTHFCASIWPEEPIPRHSSDCTECGLYRHGTRMVWGEGNPEAPIIILLDNPGARENKENEPFICGTRQTMQEAIFQAGLMLDDVYATYVLKRRPIKAYDKDTTREICMNHFRHQLSVKQPQFIICLGNVAVQSFFENQELDVKSLRGKIHVVGGVRTVAAYHPLAVRRRPNLWPIFLEDWKFLADHYKKIKT